MLRNAALAVCLIPPCWGLNPAFRISQYQKHVWRVEDGLPRNYVFTVIPGPKNYLLVGTDEGMVRFDGSRFEPFDLHPDLGLSKRWILCTMQARDGSLWIGTFDGGLSRWKQGQVLNQWNGGASIFAMVEDAHGDVWASTRNGVVRWDGTRLENIQQLPGPPDNAWNVLTADANGTVWAIGNDGLYRVRAAQVPERVAQNDNHYGQFLSARAEKDGKVYFGTSTGVFQYDEKLAAQRLTQAGDVRGPVVATLLDRAGNLWAATWGHGIFRVGEGKTESWSSRDGLNDDFIRVLYQDSDGDLWLGFRGGGLSRWRNPALVPFGVPEGFEGDFASVVAKDRTENLWLGTWRGGLYREKDGKFLNQPTPEPTPLFSVRALAFDSANRAWAGNWEGLWRLEGRKFTSFANAKAGFQRIAAIVFDRSGALWIGTSDNGIFRFADGIPGTKHAEHLLAGREITALIEDGQGVLWAATVLGAGWLERTPKLAYHAVFSTSNDAVTSLAEDSRGRIWGGTLSGSLVHLRSNKAEVIDRRRGLPGYPLYRVLDDARGSFWISSPRGILQIPVRAVDDCLSSRTARVNPTMFDCEDGMRTVECHRLSQPAGERDREGNIWFPTTSGFVKIDPANFTTNKDAPSVVIESILAGEKAMGHPAAVTLAPDRSVLSVRFTAPYFFSSDKLRFRYQLNGFDGDWTSDEGTRTAQYKGLPPGKYRLLIESALGGGRWSKPAAIDVEQQPHFYQTRWYFALLVAAFCGLVLLAMRWRLRRAKRRYNAVTEERNRIAREWHDTLVAGFSAISLQLDTALANVDGKPERARSLLEMTRAMVQHHIAEARRVIWDLRDNRPESEKLVDAVSNALQQATFGKAVETSLTVSGEPVHSSRDMEHNVVRVCQEAFSNSIRYANARKLDVEICYGGGRLELKVNDDGNGFDPASVAGLQTGHFGLTVMRERVQRFGGTFRIESQPGQGARLQVSIPLARPRK